MFAVISGICVSRLPSSPSLKLNKQKTVWSSGRIASEVAHTWASVGGKMRPGEVKAQRWALLRDRKYWGVSPDSEMLGQSVNVMLSRHFVKREGQRKLRNQAQDKTRPAHSCAEPRYRVRHFNRKCSHRTGIHSVQSKKKKCSGHEIYPRHLFIFNIYVCVYIIKSLI